MISAFLGLTHRLRPPVDCRFIVDSLSWRKMDAATAGLSPLIDPLIIVAGRHYMTLHGHLCLSAMSFISGHGDLAN